MMIIVKAFVTFNYSWKCWWGMRYCFRRCFATFYKCTLCDTGAQNHVFGFYLLENTFYKESKILLYN